MSTKHQNNLVLKIITLGTLIAVLVYLFHPGVAQFSLLINGKPVNPFFSIAALPAFMLILMMIAILSFLALMGVGMMMFALAVGFSLMGVLIIAPYFWPVLIIIMAIVLFMSAGNNKST